MASRSPHKNPNIRSSRKPGKVVERKFALCYVRMSYTLNASEADSPERQEANCRAFCERKGWLPAFYYDVDKHKSGTQEKNRPGWLALKQRMDDPDVVAIVSNDLARLHRKGWRVGQLIDWVEEHGIYLALAAPGRELDFSDPRDRLTATFIAMLDEYYAADIGTRVKDSIVYRKSKGVTVGRPPFGTIRNADGYLIPSPYGAWRLPNGDFVSGTADDAPPDPGAAWKGYYECAKTVLEKYTLGQQGTDGLAYAMTDEGWAFRNSLGYPRRFTGDDIRRITSNWREYAGMVGQGRAKDKNASLIQDASGVLYDTGRAVFDLELLHQVAEMQTQRSITTRPFGKKREAHFCALTGLLHCAHCEHTAAEKRDPTLRSRISGTKKNEIFLYRHASSHRCTCKARSVPMAVIETDFVRLLGLLSLDKTLFPSMLELSLALNGPVSGQSAEALAQEKADAIDRGKRKIEAARYLYEDGDLTRDEYLRRKEQNEAEMAHWEARTSETEQAAKALLMCVEALDKITKLWDYAEPEDRQGLARLLFESISYDLGKQQITDFRLKPWADEYLVLREALYDEDERKNHGGTNGNAGGAMSENGSENGKQKAILTNENGLERSTEPMTATSLRDEAICAPIGVRTPILLHARTGNDLVFRCALLWTTLA